MAAANPAPRRADGRGLARPAAPSAEDVARLRDEIFELREREKALDTRMLGSRDDGGLLMAGGGDFGGGVGSADAQRLGVAAAVSAAAVGRLSKSSAGGAPPSSWKPFSVPSAAVPAAAEAPIEGEDAMAYWRAQAERARHELQRLSERELSVGVERGSADAAIYENGAAKIRTELAALRAGVDPNVAAAARAAEPTAAPTAGALTVRPEDSDAPAAALRAELAALRAEVRQLSQRQRDGNTPSASDRAPAPAPPASQQGAGAASDDNAQLLQALAALLPSTAPDDEAECEDNQYSSVEDVRRLPDFGNDGAE